MTGSITNILLKAILPGGAPLISRLWICVCLALASAQHQGTPPSVVEAINICREKLVVDPHFPKIQHSLAQLLDSQISESDGNDATVAEVVRLYHAVGAPSSEVEEKRLPPAKVRFDALVRAASIAKDILRDTSRSIEYYSMAVRVDGIDEASLLLAFQAVMPMLLSSMQPDRPIEVVISPEGGLSNDDSYGDQQQRQIAFDLCDLVEAKCPTETIVDEYRGAVLRRMQQPELAYQSYLRALAKAKRNMSNEVERRHEHISFVVNFVKTSILAAAAGREAGISFQQQIAYLRDAEEVSAPLFASIDNDGTLTEELRGFFRDQMVELYNNIGIAEKKRGSVKRAREFFKKTLQINPKDGHAMVQLASVDADDVVSNVKELDSAYVSGLFDGYSARFESELVDVLHYKGHIMVFDALQRALNQLKRSPASIKRVVDLGCGTGLLGEIIANGMPWIEVLGVDLSQRMVEISRERKSKQGTDVYASVSNGDAAQYLSALEDQSVDCIGASDVFIYIGDVSKVLEQGSRCLAEGGLVAFTVESYESSTSDNGLRLLPSGRFGHSREYIAEVAKAKGFEVVSWDDCVLRQQANVDVRGAAVVLQKRQCP
ncbi:hypothetical protein ACHAXT_004547 [Thalassiosira profunda]